MADNLWLPIVQSIGIISGLVFTSVTFVRDGKAKRAANFLSLNQQHRDIWKLTLDHPELDRLREEERTSSKESLSILEERFLSFTIFHLMTYYNLWKNGQIETIDGIGDDIVSFLKPPLLREFWNKKKRFYNHDFVRFVDGYMKRAKLESMPLPSPTGLAR